MFILCRSRAGIDTRLKIYQSHAIRTNDRDDPNFDDATLLVSLLCML